MSVPDLKLVVLKTLQLEVIRNFYTRLGFQFVQEQHGTGPVHFSTPLGDGIIELYPLPKDSAVDSSIRLGFTVSNLSAVTEELGELYKVSGPKETPWGLRAIVKDPDGRSIELYQERAQ